jgi:L-aminopeptidase/D-esterase-like protein
VSVRTLVGQGLLNIWCWPDNFSDVRGRHVHSQHVAAALDNAATGPVAESILAGESWPSQPPINHLFQAALEATEEAILNSVFAAETMVGRDGHVRHAIPVEAVMEIMRRFGRGTAGKG